MQRTGICLARTSLKRFACALLILTILSGCVPLQSRDGGAAYVVSTARLSQLSRQIAADVQTLTRTFPPPALAHTCSPRSCKRLVNPTFPSGGTYSTPVSYMCSRPALFSGWRYSMVIGPAPATLLFSLLSFTASPSSALTTR